MSTLSIFFIITKQSLGEARLSLKDPFTKTLEIPPSSNVALVPTSNYQGSVPYLIMFRHALSSFRVLLSFCALLCDSTALTRLSGRHHFLGRSGTGG
jgi:hypothetical protein